MSSFPAFSHYALTVSNLQRSIEWYERLFESPPVAVNDQDNYRAAMWFEPMFAIHEISISLKATCSMNFESDSTHRLWLHESRRARILARTARCLGHRAR